MARRPPTTHQLQCAATGCDPTFDALDSNRVASPLVAAADAIVVDSTARDVDEVIHEIARRAEAAFAATGDAS